MQLAGCTHEWPFCLSKGHAQARLVCLSCECLAERCSYNEPPLCHVRINSAWHPAGLGELERLLPKHLLPKATLDLTVRLASDSSFRGPGQMPMPGLWSAATWQDSDYQVSEWGLGLQGEAKYASPALPNP